MEKQQPDRYACGMAGCSDRDTMAIFRADTGRELSTVQY